MKLLTNKALMGVSMFSTLITGALVALESSDDGSSIIDLRPYVVSGGLGALLAPESIVPVAELSGSALDRLRSNTLGDTLKGLAGVHATAFGAGASRPIIRGFDGPRVRILENSVGVIDESEASPDHAVTAVADFALGIDVLRGPATLLYGGSAIGGVINVIGGQMPILPGSGWRSSADTRYESVSKGWSSKVSSQYGDDRFAWRVNLSWREAEDYRIPGFSESHYSLDEHHEHEEDDHHDEGDHHHDEDDHHEEPERGRLGNSFSDARSGAVGLSWFPIPGARVSAGFSIRNSRYGVPGHFHPHHDDDDHHDHEQEEEHGHGHEEEHSDHAHEDSVHIQMDQWKWDLEVAWPLAGDFLQSAFFRFQYGEYQHEEIEGKEVGTRFDRKGFESRLELRHTRNTDFSGISGIQTGVMDIQARGEEALTPDTELFDLAFFALESWKGTSTSIHYGIRAEHRQMKADRHRNYDAWYTSYSAGLNHYFSDSKSLNLVLSRSARHPTHVERYAHGPHAATRQFEIGDDHLGKELSWGLDLRYDWTLEAASFSATLFANRFEDYIYAAPTNETHKGFQVFRYLGADADVVGFELEGTWQVWRCDGASLRFRGVADAVRANLRGSEEHLPRIPAARFGIGLDYQQGGLALHSTLRRVLKQEDHATYEFPSDAYTTLDVHVNYTWDWGSAKVSAFIKGNNLLDSEIRPHSSYLKDLAPMPGRGAVLGLTFQL